MTHASTTTRPAGEGVGSAGLNDPSTPPIENITDASTPPPRSERPSAAVLARPLGHDPVYLGPAPPPRLAVNAR